MAPRPSDEPTLYERLDDRMVTLSKVTIARTRTMKAANPWFAFRPPHGAEYIRASSFTGVVEAARRKWGS